MVNKVMKHPSYFEVYGNLIKYASLIFNEYSQLNESEILDLIPQEEKIHDLLYNEYPKDPELYLNGEVPSSNFWFVESIKGTIKARDRGDFPNAEEYIKKFHGKEHQKLFNYKFHNGQLPFPVERQFFSDPGLHN